MKEFFVLVVLVSIICISTNPSRSACLSDSDCGLCQKCQAEDCVFQTSWEDTKEECPDIECTSGFCNGAGACALSPPDTACTDDGNSYTDDECDGNGTCMHLTNQWVRLYDGYGSESGRSIYQTTDGGYIVAGYTNSFGAGGDDIWLLKFAGNGELMWQKTYGGSGRERGYSIQQTSDEGFIVAGSSQSLVGGDTDLLVLKLGSDGSVDWEKTYGGSEFDEARSIQEIAGGGYIVTGYTRSFGFGNLDIWLLKLDTMGDLVWEKAFGGICTYEAYTVKETTDGGYVVAGIVHSCELANRDVLILKFDRDGDLLWRRNYGGGSSEYTYAIDQASDGGYIVAGYTSSFGSTSYADIWVLKLDSNGFISWQKTFGGNLFDRAYATQHTTDGGYIVAGATQSYGSGSDDMWLIKLDSSGGIEWQKVYGGSDSDIAYSIKQVSDDGYIVAGRSFSFNEGNDGMIVLKLDSEGEIYSCDSLVSSNTTSSDTSITGGFAISPQVFVSLPTVADISVTGQSSTAEIIDVCYFDPDDVDGDGISNLIDNCPLHPNPLQEETYPPYGNGEGDACDCEGNFDCDEDCDGADAVIFKDNFGRNAYNNSCTDEPECLGDFDCDEDCDGTDAQLFKADFGRNQYDNSCPPCVSGNWCSY